MGRPRFDPADFARVRDNRVSRLVQMRDVPAAVAERNGVSLLADGSYSLGSEIRDGYPEFTYGVLKKLGWTILYFSWKDVTERPDGA